MERKFKKSKPPEYWTQVQKQFESTDFSNVLSVHVDIQCEPSLAKTLISFLTKQIYITDDLDIKIRFDNLSPTSRFNFISLLALSSNRIPTVPDLLLNDPFLKSIYDSYTANPPEFLLDIPTELPVEEIIDQEETEPPEIQFGIRQPEFFDELDLILASHPSEAEQIVHQYLQAKKLEDFSSILIGFYSGIRSLEGSIFVIRYFILPYITALTANANRIISDALLQICSRVPELTVDELIQPIVFDPESTIYQFSPLNQLFREPLICQNALLRLFQSRNPAIEAKLNDEALKFIELAIQKSPQLPDPIQKHVLLHIHNQIEQNEKASRLLNFYFKNQLIRDPEIKSIAMNTLSLIPEEHAKIALQNLNR